VINAGDLHWKIVSVYVNKMNQVIIALPFKPKFVLLLFWNIKSLNYSGMMSVDLI
jgi:hypothetical protein